MSNQGASDEDVMVEVISNEVTCRAMLNYLEVRGCKFSVPIEKMGRDDMAETVIQVLSELKRREATKENHEKESGA